MTTSESREKKPSARHSAAEATGRTARAPSQIADAPRAEHVVSSASERAGTEGALRRERTAVTARPPGSYPRKVSGGCWASARSPSTTGTARPPQIANRLRISGSAMRAASSGLRRTSTTGLRATLLASDPAWCKFTRDVHASPFDGRKMPRRWGATGHGGYCSRYDGRVVTAGLSPPSVRIA